MINGIFNKAEMLYASPLPLFFFKWMSHSLTPFCIHFNSHCSSLQRLARWLVRNYTAVGHMKSIWFPIIQRQMRCVLAHPTSPTPSFFAHEHRYMHRPCVLFLFLSFPLFSELPVYIFCRLALVTAYQVWTSHRPSVIPAIWGQHVTQDRLQCGMATWMPSP